MMSALGDRVGTVAAARMESTSTRVNVWSDGRDRTVNHVSILSVQSFYYLVPVILESREVLGNKVTKNWFITEMFQRFLLTLPTALHM